MQSFNISPNSSRVYVDITDDHTYLAFGCEFQFQIYFFNGSTYSSLGVFNLS